MNKLLQTLTLNKQQLRFLIGNSLPVDNLEIIKDFLKIIQYFAEVLKTLLLADTCHLSKVFQEQPNHKSLREKCQ